MPRQSFLHLMIAQRNHESRRRRGNESLIFSENVVSCLIRDSLPRLLRFMKSLHLPDWTRVETMNWTVRVGRGVLTAPRMIRPRSATRGWLRTARPTGRFMEGLDLQGWTRIGTMNCTHVTQTFLSAGYGDFRVPG